MPIGVSSCGKTELPSAASTGEDSVAGDVCGGTGEGVGVAVSGDAVAGAACDPIDGAGEAGWVAGCASD